VPSAGYQFSFAPKSDWSRYYSPAREIQEYYADFARKGAYVGKYINLKHEVTKAEWDESTSQWVLMISKTTDAGTETFEDRVDFVDGNIGVLNTWKWPDIPNREAFKGQMAHSADYDTSISVEGKRVAVIGSGASSIQIIPAIQKTAAEVIAFYRTPQWISTGVSLEGLTDLAGSNFDCELNLVG
jgi:cation diffusion facilitator CzcD-associated flavoprotein CzcO